jgi:hypothetical protein
MKHDWTRRNCIKFADIFHFVGIVQQLVRDGIRQGWVAYIRMPIFYTPEYVFTEKLSDIFSIYW